MAIKKFFRFMVDVINSSVKDSIGAYTANAAFFITISFIPFIMLLISILKFLPLGEKEIVAQIASMFPAGARDITATIIAESYDKSGTAVISIAAVSTLWAASMGVHSLAKGIDRAYTSEKPKSMIRLRLKSTLYTLVLFAVIIFWLAIFVFGDTITAVIVREIPWMKNVIPFLSRFESLWVMLFLCAFFLAMYTVIPGKKVRLIAQIPGTLIGGIGCLGISRLFTYYYENLFDYSYVYGGLTLLVVFMLWLFFCLYTLFIGAEVNKCLGERLERAELIST